MALTFNDEQEAELLDLLGLPKADPGTTVTGTVFLPFTFHFSLNFAFHGQTEIF